MANILDYVKWRGDLSFEKDPFNKIDALVLSHLSYSIFDGLISDSFTERKTLKQLAEDFNKTSDYEERVNIGFLINKQTVDLMQACADSVRFGNIEICGYRLVYNTDETVQFAAMTYFAGKKTIISYRGTDDSITGWHEDFNIGWQEQIPAQKEAIKYINDASEAISGKFTLVGHSKGGYLVVDTAVRAAKKLQKRIEQLYNFDGPGFDPDFYEKPEFLAIADRLQSVYPEFSVVGMVFHKYEKNFQIVKSEGFAVMQHDAMRWQVLGTDYDEAEDFKPESKFFHEAFNEWAYGLTKDQIQKFVTALFDVIEASGATTLNELEGNTLQCTAKMMQKLSSLDRETKREVRKVLRLLKSVVRKDSPLAKLLTLPKKTV